MRLDSQFGSEQLWFLLLSWAISLLSAYAMFLLVGNADRNKKAATRYWIAAAAAVFGFGSASMHVVTMLAFEYMIAIDVTSIFVAVGCSLLAYAAFRVMAREEAVGVRLPLSALLLSGAACGLFYLNLFGSQFQAAAVNRELIGISASFSLLGSAASLYLLERRAAHYKWMCALLFGCASTAMVLFGMEGVLGDANEPVTTDKLNEMLRLMVAIIGFGTLLVLCFSLAAWLVVRRFYQIDERYKSLVENSMDMIAILCQEKWEYVNKAGLRLLEAETESELIGGSVFAFLDPKHHDDLRRRLSSLGPGGAYGPLEQEWYTVRNKLIHTEVVVSASTWAGKPAVQVIVRDISERKKNEELLINSEKLYVAGQLAAGIAHEIRNPLTSLKGFLQLLATGRGSSGNYFDIMKSELNRIESIVSEMLMLSKPQVYELTHRDAREIVFDTVNLLAPQALLDSIEVETDLGQEPLWVHGVENQIKQVVLNVLKNAIEAMTGGGTIRVSCLREQGEVVIRIADQGPGIGEEQLSKMGQPFYTTKEKGTGLGLMVSYKIVDNHGGRIRATSELGSGTTVDIVLPYTAPPSGDEAGPGSAGKRAPGPAAYGTRDRDGLDPVI